MDCLDDYSSFLYEKTSKKIHWYLGTCCLDHVNQWCESNITNLKYNAEIGECDILVVGTKLSRSDIEFINFDEQLQQLESLSEGLKIPEGVDCSACDQLPAGDLQDQCRSGLGC